MSGIPQLETERLILRAPHMKDLDAMAQFFASPRSQSAGGPLDRGQVWRALLRSAGHWHLRGYGLWHAIDKSSATMCGYCGFIEHIEWPEAELAWGVYDGYEGKGFAYEAALAARAAGPALGVPQPMSLIDPDNARSRRLAERLGAWVEAETLLLNEPVVIYRHPKPEGA